MKATDLGTGLTGLKRGLPPSTRRSSMRSYCTNLGAGLQGLKLRETKRPSPGPNEVLVRLRATSLNYRELSIIQAGVYPLPVKQDLVPLCDGAGEVVELGSGVTRVCPNDRVMANVFPQWLDGPFGFDKAAQLGGSLDGMLCEYIVLHEDALVHIPAHLSFEEAAALPCAGVTAWNALHGGKLLRPGEWVLTLGSGSVSLFAIQFAKAAGARVVATTSDEKKAARLRSLGAEAVVNYREMAQWPQVVRERTGGAGVDHVVEVGGGATLGLSLQAAAMNGEVALVGHVADGPTSIDANTIFMAGATIRPVAIGSRAQFDQMNRVIDAHQLHPVIDRVFSFDEAPAALAYYAAGSYFGKVVIQIGHAAA